VLLGGATAAGLAARFAATDLAAPHRRARALATVVWATTVGAVAGPNLGAPAQRLGTLLGLEPAAGPFLCCLLVFALAATLTVTGLRPDPLVLARAPATGPDSGAGRPAVSARAALRAAPAARLGVAGIVLCHLIMVGLMSMTPVHMGHGGATLQLVGLVISLHVAGMYALAPVFGWLADRVGRRPVVLLGQGLLVAALVLSWLGAGSHALVTVSLVLLGLGWSASTVAGSALVAESVPPAEAPRLQGVSDLFMNLAGATGGALAGPVLAFAGFEGLSAVLVVLVVLVVLAHTARPVAAASGAGVRER
jgi:predicted MFS family arabinose efflux permease